MDTLQILDFLFIRSSAIVILTLLLTFLLGKRLSANVRQALIAFTLFVLLLVPIAKPLMPNFSLQDLLSIESKQSGSVSTVMYLDDTGNIVQEVTDGTTGSVPASLDQTSGISAAANTSPGPLFSLQTVFFIVWVIGVALLLGRLFIGYLRIQHMSQTSRYSVLSNNIPWMSELLDALNIRRSVRVAYNEKVTVPMVWGIMYPTLLLPLSARSWGQQRLRTLLLHEFAHIRRWDYLAHLLGKIVTALYWMNPLVWIATNKMSEEQERACDNHVLATGTPSHEYAQHLLDFMKSLHERNEISFVPAVAMGLRTKKVKERMEALLDDTVSRKSMSFISLIMFAVISGCAVVPIAAVNFTAGSSGGLQNSSYIFLEAEDTRLPAALRVVPGIYASGERFIQVKDDVTSRNSPAEDGVFSYDFRVQKPGNYIVWARTQTNDNDEDSFWVRVDQGKWIKWNSIEGDDDWIWDEVHDTDNNNKPVLFHLGRGKHTLEFSYREDEIALDKILITDQINFKPTGRNPVTPDKMHKLLTLETAEVNPGENFQVFADENAMNGQYIAASSRQQDDVDDLPAKADLTYEFRVTQDGNYHIWGRVFSDSGSENSFWIRVDDSPWILWNDLDDHDQWHWKEVYDSRTDEEPIRFELERGVHRIEIAHREKNAALDELLITDAPGFFPRAIAAR